MLKSSAWYPLVILAALASGTQADTYLEFSHTVRTNNRLVSHYIHKIWIGNERARIDDSAAVTWLIQRDPNKVYRVDQRQHSAAELPSMARTPGFGCEQWELEGEVATEKLSSWETEVSTYECAGLRSQRPGAPDPANRPDPRFEARRRQMGYQVKVWTSSEIKLDPDRFFSAVAGAGVWGGLARLWMGLPAQGDFPIQIETQISRVQTVYTLIKIDEVQVPDDHYKLPPQAEKGPPEPEGTEAAPATQPSR